MQVKQLPSESFTPITLQITIDSKSELSWLWERVNDESDSTISRPKRDYPAQRDWAMRNITGGPDDSADVLKALKATLNDLVKQQIESEDRHL